MVHKDNGACTSSDEEDNMLGDEDLVDNLPTTAVELKYYVSNNSICILQNNLYYLDNTTLYTKFENNKYYAYDLQPIRYMRIPLRLSDKSIELAEIELLLDLSNQDEKYINELQQHVYSVDGSRKYYDLQEDNDSEFIPDYLLSEEDN